MSSLIGKLFSGLPTTSSSAPRPAKTLDSSLEDQFTYNLLFPDPESLCHNDQVFPLSTGTALTPATVNAFDVNTDIDIELRDVRVIIMQEATPTSGSAYLLFDSHPLPAPLPGTDRQPTSNASVPPPRSENRRSTSSPRKSSVGQTSRPLVIQEVNGPQPFGAFGRRAANNHKTLSLNETESQRSIREYREEVTTFSNCIFGNSDVLAYKGTGTKVHILPSSPFAPSSYAGEGSFGRSSMRSSKLAQSFTSENVKSPGPTSAGFGSSSPPPSRTFDRKKVLITRMFPVPLPNDDPDETNHTPTQYNAGSEEVAGYPFPKVGDNGMAKPDKKPQPKQKRTPMYAVGMLVHLPPSSHLSGLPTSRSSFRGPGSYNEHESCPSSFGSTRRTGWTMLGHGFGIESMESSFTSDGEDRIDIVTQHWDIIMRTLSHLQAVATSALLPLLKAADLASPEPRRDSNASHHRAPSASISISGRRVLEEVKPFKIPKTNAKRVQLTSNCLMGSQKIHREVDASRQRIVSGIKALQVVTGQGRWGIWREEARLVGKWAGGKDEGFFFYNLLTGFLGNHTEWLQALGPSWYRRRHYQQQRANKDDEISLPARTIIVSDNKQMARRLIFLLSAFLPSNQQLTPTRLHRPSTSTSFGGYSQSPPTYAVPILREESLRRRINKRVGVSRSTHTRTLSFPAQGNAHSNHLPLEIHHDRRPSDATSIKTANLPIPGSDIGTRKSSAATTSTVTPITTMPHFSTRRPDRGTGPAPRPGSSGSLATDDLLRSLKRGESTGYHSTTSSDSHGQNSRWGSMISGFWSSKRRDSTAASEIDPLSIEGLEINDPHYRGSPPKRGGKLAEMVKESKQSPIKKSELRIERETRNSDGSTTTARPEEDHTEETQEQNVPFADRIPDPSGAYESPVKTSINESDGVIDIDVPLPDYLAFETAVSSPSSSGYLSTPGLGNGMEAFEHSSRINPDGDNSPLNVAGWLQRYHPDFALQAIPSSQADLIEEVKASMRAEPTATPASTPNPDSGRADRWVDVSSAVIADTTNFTIKYIRYKRLIRYKDISASQHHTTATSTTTVGGNLSSSLDSRYGNVYTATQLTPSVIEPADTQIEERFIEEPILSMDETLIEAVERIIAQSRQASKMGSAASSRSTSRKGGAGHERSSSSIRGGGEGIVVPELRGEVPRNECKRTVLRALEEIVREVAESRREEGAAGEGEGSLERGRDGERMESFLREGVRSWLVNVEATE